ncbi:MAG: hypothetical protein V3U98_03245 [Acidobacteriota bacterium]
MGRYLEALQAEDLATVALFSAEYQDEVRGLEGPAAQEVYERFVRRVEDRLLAYEQAKRSGAFEVLPDATAFLRGLMLGKGGYYQVREVRSEEAGARARIEVQMGYHAIPFENFPPGTRVYLMGVPPGSLLAPVRGEAPQRLEVLASLQLDCWLEPETSPKHPTGWRVRRFTVVPDSVRSAVIEWR